jgi:hypothetical protein
MAGVRTVTARVEHWRVFHCVVQEKAGKERHLGSKINKTDFSSLAETSACVVDEGHARHRTLISDPISLATVRQPQAVPVGVRVKVATVDLQRLVPPDVVGAREPRVIERGIQAGHDHLGR